MAMLRSQERLSFCFSSIIALIDDDDADADDDDADDEEVCMYMCVGAAIAR